MLRKRKDRGNELHAFLYFSVPYLKKGIDLKFTHRALNIFTFWKLPAAWWSGVRVAKISETTCCVQLRLNFFNKNPFKSVFWAVQGMAAELSTGVLLMREIHESDKKVSMLVLQNKAVFTKKARGKIEFVCEQGAEVKKTIALLLQSKQPQTVWLSAVGTDAEGDQVAHFEFEWTLKEKK